MQLLKPPGRVRDGWVLMAVATVALLLGTSCGPSKPTAAIDQRQMVSFWQPHLLYLKSVPHASLYVEIDAVEGAEPGRFEIDRLKTFLERYCDKPDGIEVALGAPIPASEAQGESEQSLALKHLDGPPPGSIEKQPAFLYVLFYDSRLCGSENDEGEGSGRWAKGPFPLTAVANRWNGISSPWRREHGRGKKVKARKPHVNLLPYPGVIFIDRQYDPWGHAMWDLFLLHEAGHLLGLARGLDHGDGMHCSDKRCLMNEKARMGFLSWLVGRERPQYQHDLCDRCKSELEGYRALHPDPGLGFLGPVLVRSEGDYHVLSLPGFVELYVGQLESLMPASVLKDARRVAANLEDGGVWVSYRTELGEERDYAALTAALRHACYDPYELVRRIAERQILTARVPGK
jgi:hypothetical protein